MTPTKEEIARLAKGLTDGVKIIMRREAYSPIRKSDWRGVRPNDAAFEHAHRKGLISFWPGDGDPFWTIDEPLGLALRTHLLEQEQEAQNGQSI